MSTNPAVSVLNLKWPTFIVLSIVTTILLIVFLALHFDKTGDVEKKKKQAKNVGIACAVFASLTFLVFLAWYFNFPK